MRREGNARDPDTLREILKHRQLPAAIATAEQIHGSGVAVVSALKQRKRFPSADGLLTDLSMKPLGIFTADCAPVFLKAERPGVVGILHAGWRGIHAGILGKAWSLLRRRWLCRPQDVRVWMGPAIGPCCFEVRWDVARFFPATRRRQGERWTVDLAGEIRTQARRLGLKMEAGSRSVCTAHQRRFYSYRRDRTENRHISVIMKRD